MRLRKFFNYPSGKYGFIKANEKAKHLSGSTGKFTAVKYGLWQNAIDKGFTSIGSEKIKNIKKTAENQRACSQIALCPKGDEAASVFWADDCTISISEDGTTIIVKGYLAPCGNSEGREATATYTRKK